ncbi:NAD-P-binding protein [Marasmius fiardii PR-910]|nr:NAD-P-binding protein [Marasmius fiardii PR-910]
MAPHTKQIVFLVGATGRTGSSILQALLKQPEIFEVKALVRPTSMDKPTVQELRTSGVEVIPGDMVTDAEEALAGHLKNVDTLIITSIPFEEGQQNKLLIAAKNAGVKRVIPSEFGPSAPPGAMKYHDSKLKTRQFITENKIPYTFIQVGWWSLLLFPYPHSAPLDQLGAVGGKSFYGTGKVKTAYTALDRIGEFVTRIISDPRTLNRVVQTWDGETTLEESWAIASKVAGESFDDYPRISAEDIESKLKDTHDIITRVTLEYHRSLFIRGDNTVEKAVALGALDARALYPDYVPLTLEEAARQFYSSFRVD